MRRALLSVENHGTVLFLDSSSRGEQDPTQGIRRWSLRGYSCKQPPSSDVVIEAPHLKLRPPESKGSHWDSDIAEHGVGALAADRQSSAEAPPKGREPKSLFNLCSSSMLPSNR